jgi:hypothetical protein
MKTPPERSGRLTNEEFDELHRLTGEAIMAALENATGSVCEECGCGGSLPPALLAQAIKFLGENQINRPQFTSKQVAPKTKPSRPKDDDDSDVLHLFRKPS